MTNPLRYVKQLESVGLSREQAEAYIQILSEYLEGELATKQDLLNLQTEMNLRFEAFNHRLIEMESRLVIKMGAMMTVMAGLIVSFVFGLMKVL